MVSLMPSLCTHEITVGLVCYARLSLCDFYFCDNTKSQTPPSRVESGHRTTCSSREKSYQPVV